MKRMELIQPLTDEMIKNLARLVKYNSVEGEALPGMPFGEVPAAVLAEALQIADEMGFKTVNMENYCGYAEMGEGKEIIGIAAHLDIVPAGEGWDTDPFELTQKDGILYGRGVSDDKGALIASLYAMKLVKESGVKLNKRVRLLMGTNEETGSACMKYYTAHEEPISAGFTPDGGFPGIYGEKGMLGLLLRSKKTSILSMNGGFVTNAVCNHCETTVPAGCVSVDALEEELAKTPLTSSCVNVNDDGSITIDAVGAAAHASTPLEGVNAASYTMLALKNAGMKDEFVDYYLSRIGTTCDGEGISLKIADDYGALTLNNGIVSTKDGVITCTIDIRYPVTYTPDQVRALVAPYADEENGSISITRVSAPLFYAPDSALVKNLHQAYIDITGDTVSQPEVIGGGTYAKSIPGIIAFGCEFPGVNGHIHDKNELLSVEDFQKQVAIYVEAILNLLKI